jgi:hypothetical protein
MDLDAMNLEQLFCPRKTRKTRKNSKKRCQVLDYYPKSERLNKYNTLAYLVSFVLFVFFVDKSRFIAVFRMTRSIFSSSWHSVAELKPRLIPQARVHRHVYRGQVTLVPKLQLGNPDSEALASRDGKLELPTLNSQAGAWELAQKSIT